MPGQVAYSVIGFAGLNSFLEAILIESESEVKARLTKDAILDRENLLKQSALHLAVSHPQHLQLLLENGANVNARDWGGRTPLMYAAAAGAIEVAIALLRGGADPWIKDNQYGKEDFINYAIRQEHWDLVMAALDYIRQSAQYSTEQVRSLLNTAIILWAGENLKHRRSCQFKNLLNWGADPEIRFKEKWEYTQTESNNTLLHCITNLTDFDTLVTSGFSSFNHSNSTGAHALMKIAVLCDARLLQKCVEGGSRVDHQNHEGRTTLHISLEDVWESFLDVEYDQCEHWTEAMGCAKALLKADAYPSSGDLCRCACSNYGCTPAHILLKAHHKFGKYAGSYPLVQYIWSFEWLHLLKDVKGLESAKECVLDMLRLAKFEELNLTHTCCRKYHRKGPWHVIDEDEVFEIMDEEKEMIEDLELQMRKVEHGLSSNLEEAWMMGLTQLLTARQHIDSCSGTGLETEVLPLAVEQMTHFQYLMNTAPKTEVGATHGRFMGPFKR